MSVRTIEQKMNAACIWNGAAPFGDLVRGVTPNAADSVTALTKTWVFANAAFVAADVGRKFLVANAATPGNNGTWTIATVVGPTTVTTVEAPAGDETFSGGTTTAAIYAASQSVSGNDMDAFPEGISGGLFDFGVQDPMIVQQLVIKFGSGTTSWALELVDVDGVATQVAGASSAAPYFASTWNGRDASGLILLQGQKLRLSSAGGPTSASRARISVGRHLS